MQRWESGNIERGQGELPETKRVHQFKQSTQPDQTLTKQNFGLQMPIKNNLPSKPGRQMKRTKSGKIPVC